MAEKKKGKPHRHSDEVYLRFVIAMETRLEGVSQTQAFRMEFDRPEATTDDSDYNTLYKRYKKDKRDGTLPEIGGVPAAFEVALGGVFPKKDPAEEARRSITELWPQIRLFAKGMRSSMSALALLERMQRRSRNVAHLLDSPTAFAEEVHGIPEITSKQGAYAEYKNLKKLGARLDEHIPIMQQFVTACERLELEDGEEAVSQLFAWLEEAE